MAQATCGPEIRKFCETGAQTAIWTSSVKRGGAWALGQPETKNTMCVALAALVLLMRRNGPQRYRISSYLRLRVMYCLGEVLSQAQMFASWAR